MLNYRQIINTSGSAVFLELIRVTIIAVGRERVNELPVTTRMVNVVCLSDAVADIFLRFWPSAPGPLVNVFV